MTIANHLVLRGNVWQYVRKVPSDLVLRMGIPAVRQSLRTRDEKRARALAVELDQKWDQEFASLRLRGGRASERGSPAAVLTVHWTWADWKAVVEWFECSLAEEDWQERLKSLPGSALGPDKDPALIPWREDAAVRRHLDRTRILNDITVEAYAETQRAFVQSYVGRLGIQLTSAAPSFTRFMAECLAAELRYLKLFREREGRKGGFGNPHPDDVEGPWRIDKPAPAKGPSAPVQAGVPLNITWDDALRAWVNERTKTKRAIHKNYLTEIRAAVAQFKEHSGITDLGLVTREAVIDFRAYLDAGHLQRPSINKKISILSSLLGAASLINARVPAVGDGLLLSVAKAESSRHPYTPEHLDRIFAHPIFTERKFFTSAKAGQEIQFWFPLIACCHGMIPTEIAQLGHDTVVPHPEAPEILCFEVTNANGRTMKTLARKRWMPIRKELIELGLLEVISVAKSNSQRFLWSALEKDSDLDRVCGNFSSFWSRFQYDEIGLEDEVTFYSFRHYFQDQIGRLTASQDLKKLLMGHSESGMTGVYGEKRRARVVPIRELDDVIQRMEWPFLSRLVREA